MLTMLPGPLVHLSSASFPPAPQLLSSPRGSALRAIASPTGELPARGGAFSILGKGGKGGPGVQRMEKRAVLSGAGAPESLLGLTQVFPQASGSSTGGTGLRPRSSCRTVPYLSTCWSCAQLSLTSRCLGVTRAARLGCRLRSWDTVTSSIWKRESSWGAMTGLARDEPPQPRCECMMATHLQPCGGRRGSKCQVQSPAVPGEAPPSITQPWPPHTAVGCPLSPQPW